MKQGTPKTIYLKEYQAPDFQIKSVDLEFDLGEDKTLVTSCMSLVRLVPDVPLVLDGHDMKLVSVLLDDRELSHKEYELGDESLVIPVIPDQFTLKVITELKPQENTSLEGLYKSSGNFCTQCEAEGFRKITYYLDRPDVMSVFTTTIRADKEKYPVLLSNGNPVASGHLDDGRHWVKWHDPFRKPSYLFALVAGNLECIEDVYTTGSGRNVALRIFVEKENVDKCEHAMNSLKKAMRWDEERFGLEYDLDIYMIVAVNDFNMGAMENKGLNVFNSKLVLARPDTATDADYEAIEGVIGHEYFHNWTGNRVTCRDWFQLSLKEGLTVFRDQEFSSDMQSRAVKRIQDVRMLRSHQFAEDAGPMAHPVRPQSYMEINNFYTLTVYEKGAEVVRMYHTLLGEEGFRKGIDLYFQRHDGQAVTTDDFRKAMADANGVNLDAFQSWYDYAGTPEVQVEAKYDAVTQRYSLKMKQQCPATPGQDKKPAFVIPNHTVLIDREQGLLKDTDKVLILEQEEQVFVYENIRQEPVPSFLRGFSAPVKLNYPYRDEELAFLMVHESDPFNRWDAGQTLFMRILLNMIDELAQEKTPVVPDVLITAVRGLLNDRSADKALVAEALLMPSESYLADQVKIVDVDVIHKARDLLKTTLNTQLRDDFLSTYRDNNVDSEYRFTPGDVGQRSLKNIALAYLMHQPDEEIMELCLEQYYQGNNMTDVMAALSCIVDIEDESRELCLAHFYDKWRHETLVLDKWLGLQARSRRKDTLENVKALMGHTAFDMRNPNKVRALIGGFVMGNPLRFHASDGKGYDFLADRVIELDRINPQITARLVQAFSKWRRHEETRKRKMEQALRRILKTEALSRDTFEIVSRMLA